MLYIALTPQIKEKEQCITKSHMCDIKNITHLFPCVFPDIYALAVGCCTPLGIMHIYQATHPCLC